MFIRNIMNDRTTPLFLAGYGGPFLEIIKKWPLLMTNVVRAFDEVIQLIADESDSTLAEYVLDWDKDDKLKMALDTSALPEDLNEFLNSQFTRIIENIESNDAASNIGGLENAVAEYHSQLRALYAYYNSHEIQAFSASIVGPEKYPKVNYFRNSDGSPLSVDVFLDRCTADRLGVFYYALILAAKYSLLCHKLSPSNLFQTVFRKLEADVKILIYEDQTLPSLNLICDMAETHLNKVVFLISVIYYTITNLTK